MVVRRRAKVSGQNQAALTKRQLTRESLAKNLAVASLDEYRREANQEEGNLHFYF